MSTRVPVSSRAVCLVLCACAPVTEQGSGTRLVTGAASFGVPAPGGPAVVGVVERRYSNAIEQTIALETHAVTEGQNSLRVRVLGLARAKEDDALVQPALTDAVIADEMRTAFPGVTMSISPEFVQNSYGPFGYAVGRGAGRDLCLYAWQHIGGTVTTPFVRQGAIETRLRLCQAGAEERTLLAGMYGYTVQASFGPGWSTGSPAPLLPAAIGAAGMPIYPAAVQPVTELPEPPGRSTGPEIQVRPSRTEPAVADPGPATPTAGATAWAATELPAGAPVVPLPSGPAPTFSADASPLAAVAATSGTPRVPSPPARVIVPGLSGDVTR